MAKIVVTTVGNAIYVEFNDYSTLTGYTKGTWELSHMLRVQLLPSIVVMQMLDSSPWPLSHIETLESFQVDSINGVAITSNDDLYTKLSTLME